MRLHVDGWDPAYGTGFEASQDTASEAERDLDVELPSDAWQPLVPAPDVRAPGSVTFVDGVLRLDANVWVVGDGGSVHAGLCASYAAGVVRCDGTAEVVDRLVERGLFTASPDAVEVRLPGSAAVRYPVRHVRRDEPDARRLAVQEQLRLTEVTVGELARAAGPDGDLLVVDGPLHGRVPLPRTVGYVKSHERRYLPPHLESVVTALRAGQRTPVFLLGTRWQRYAWYLRLPCSPGAPWAGVVRVECTAETAPAEAIALADLSAVTLPRFASREHRDPRAPQNLVPIAGLERALRARLGDVRLLRRGLRAAARSDPVPVA